MPRIQMRRESALALLLVSSCATAQVQKGDSILVGADQDGNRVKLFDSAGEVQRDFFPFASGFTGGVRVALGDVSGDGTPDLIVAAGPGAGPHVRVFDGLTNQVIMDFDAYRPDFSGGVHVAAGDVNGDGLADIIVSPDAGAGPRIRVFSSRSGAVLHDFHAYDPGFQGGVFVSAGDIDGDRRADIITAPASGAGPHVKVFSGSTGSLLHSFFAFATNFTGGVTVAGGDFDGDGVDDIITGAGAGGGPHVKVFSGRTSEELASFFAYTPSFTGGVRVGAGDINDDGLADIITTPGSGSAPQIARFLGPNAEAGATNLAFDVNYTGGVFVASQLFVPTIFRDGYEPLR